MFDLQDADSVAVGRMLDFEQYAEVISVSEILAQLRATYLDGFPILLECFVSYI